MQAKEKSIVYYVSQKDGANRAFTANELLENIPLHREVENYYRNHNESLGIRCIETSKSIHDRFVFTRSGENVECLVVGTSFNSLWENFYCIHQYQGTTAQSLYKDIKKRAIQPYIDRESKIL